MIVLVFIFLQIYDSLEDYHKYLFPNFQYLHSTEYQADCPKHSHCPKHYSVKPENYIFRFF